MREIWVEAKGFPDYLVSNLGRVMTRESDIRITPFVSNGREAVSLQHGDSRFVVMLDRLVAHSFFEGLEEGVVIRHIDGDKTNVVITNLEIVSREEHRESSYEVGREKRPIRIKNLDTGEVYQSANEAGRKLGLLSNVYIPRRARESGAEWRSGGYRLKLV